MITKQIGALLVAGDYKMASDAEPFFTARPKSGNRLRQWLGVMTCEQDGMTLVMVNIGRHCVRFGWTRVEGVSR